MGLFDKVMGKDGGKISLNKQEAFAAIAVATVGADGDVSEEEVQRIVVNFAALNAFRRSNIRDIGDNLNQVAKLIKRHGAPAVVEAAKSTLPKESLNTAFFLAADLALADGVVEPKEEKFLEELQKTLGVDQALAEKIVEVVVIKNKA